MPKRKLSDLISPEDTKTPDTSEFESVGPNGSQSNFIEGSSTAVSGPFTILTSEQESDPTAVDTSDSAEPITGGMKQEVFVISELTQEKFEISRHDGDQVQDDLHEENTDQNIEEDAGHFEESLGVVDESGIGIESTEEHLVQLVDFSGCCANCSVPFDNSECPKISELILSAESAYPEGGEEDSQRLHYGIVVAVADALSFIFEMKLNEDQHGGPLVDSGIGVCNKCGDILAHMYKLHRDFYEAAATNSYLDLLFSKVFTTEEATKDISGCSQKLTAETSKSVRTSIPDAGRPQPSSTGDVFENSNEIRAAENPAPDFAVTSQNPPDTPGNNLNPQTQNSLYNAIQPGPPNYLVICPLVIATNAGTSNAGSDALEVKNEDDIFFKDLPPSASADAKKGRARQKYSAVCPECGKTFKSYVKNALEIHINVVHRNCSPHTCEICGRPCSSHKNLQAHLRTHLGKCERVDVLPTKTSSKQFLCTVCGQTLKSASSLRLHYSKHTNPRPFQCDKCDRRFGDKVSLRRHQVIHEENGIFPFTCTACGSAFKLASFLKEHNMFCISKSSERPHKCNHCGKRFKLKQHLELHLHEMHQFTKDEAREVVYPGLPRKKRAK